MKQATQKGRQAQTSSVSHGGLSRTPPEVPCSFKCAVSRGFNTCLPSLRFLIVCSHSKHKWMRLSGKSWPHVSCMNSSWTTPPRFVHCLRWLLLAFNLLMNCVVYMGDVPACYSCRDAVQACLAPRMFCGASAVSVAP